MKVCPNKRDKNWIKLVDSVGEFEAYRVFISNNYEIPSSPEVNEFEELEKKLKLRNKDGELKRYPNNDKNFREQRQNIIALNRSSLIPRGYKASYVPAKPEKGDKREYMTVKIVPIPVKGSQESPRSQIIQSIFGDKNKLSSKEVLEGIVKNLEGTNKAGWATMSKRLLGLVSNNVPVEVISKEEMSKYQTYDSKGNVFIAGGVFVPNENKIYLLPNQDVKVLIHEILHAFSYHHLRTNSEYSKELNRIYEFLKENHSDKFNEDTTSYAMQNLDEFMVGIFTNPEFMSVLKSIPSTSNKKLTIWDELVDFFTTMFNHFGFSKTRANSLFEESMNAAIKVLEENKEISDSYSYMEEYIPEEYKEVYASLSEEEREDFLKDLHGEEEYEKIKAEITEEKIEEEPIEDYERESEKKKEKESKTITDIRDRLVKVRKVLADKVRDTRTQTAVDKLHELEDKLETLSDAEAIHQYIISANEIALSYRTRMDELMKSSSIDDASELTFIHDFVAVFDNLSSLNSKMFSEKETERLDSWYKAKFKAEEEDKLFEFLKENPKPTSTLIQDTVEILRTINEDYLNTGRDILAQKLFSFEDEDAVAQRKKLKDKLLKDNPKNAYALSLATTWQELSAQMKEASRDIDAYERWLTSALGGSTNDMIALTAKMIKEKTSEAQDKLRDYEEKLGEAFEKVKATGVGLNNPMELNERFLEKVVRTRWNSELGVDEETEVWEFIEEKDWKRYKDNLAEFRRTFNNLRETNLPEYRKLLAKWYKGNSKARSNAKDIIASKKKELTEYQYSIWAAKNIIDEEAGIYKSEELNEPNDSYTSQKYLDLQKDKVFFEYYRTLREVHNELKLLLPPDVRERMGNMIPTIYKSDWERGVEGGVGKVIKDKFRKNEGDINYQENVLVGLDGKKHRSVPFYFTGTMKAEDTSVDILQSLLQAAKHWNLSRAKMDIMSEVQLIEDIISDPEGLKVVETNAKGEGLFDKFSNLGKFIPKEGQSRLAERMDEVLKDAFYGIEDEATIFNLPLVGEVSMDKVTQTTLKATSIVGLAGNIFSGVTNLIMGNLNNLIEAHSGEFINKKNLAVGQKYYWKYVSNLIGDRHKLVGKHWFTKVIEDFDLLHGEYFNSFGENVSGSRAKKEASSNHLMFLQQGAEHEINITNGLAFLDSVRWIDGAFIQKKDYKGDEKIFNSAKSLLVALEEGEGKLVGEYEGAWTFKQREKLKNRVHELNKYVHGNYAREDRTGLQRRWYGKLALMFKKFVVPGMARRWGAERYNTATGTTMGGFYRSSFVAMYEFYKGVRADMQTMGLMEAMKNNNLTPEQRVNMRRMVAEGVFFVLALALVSVMTPDDDEEKNEWWGNSTLLIARRLQSELSFYANPDETWRILKTPIIAMNFIDDVTDFAGGLIFKWGEDESYQRNTGIWEKGDSKDLARLVNLLPVVGKIMKAQAPEEQLKVFNR